MDFLSNNIRRAIIDDDIIDLTMILFDKTIDLTINDYVLIKLANLYGNRKIIRLMAKHPSVTRPKNPNLPILSIIVSSLSEKTNLYLEEVLIHPQNKYYGLTKTKKVGSGLMSFLNDPNNTGLLRIIKNIGNEPEIFAHINKVILGSLAVDFGCLMGLFVHNIPSKKSGDAYNLIIFSDENAPKNAMYFPEWLIKHGLLTNLININKKNTNALKKCYDKGTKYISVNIYIYITNKYVRTDILNIPNTAHSTQIFIDAADRNNIRIISFESSVSLYYEEYEKEFAGEIVKIIGEILCTDKISYVTFAQESCPLFSIQGKSGTCTYWALYLFYLYILNNHNRSKIYKSLMNVDLKYRNRLLSQFIYYLSSIIDYKKLFVSPSLKKDLVYLKSAWLNNIY